MLNNIQPIKLGNLEFSLIQGGMGVGISQDGLAAAVANEGGAGIIAGAEIGGLKGYPGSYEESNSNALRDTIRSARAKSNGVIGVNIMHVLTAYQSLVETAIAENVDLIISGAGIPLDLPKYLRTDSKTKLLPIVSSARLAGMMCKSWSRYNHLPEGIVVEGPKAGGHEGFSKEQMHDSEFVANALERIILEVVEAVKPYEQASERRIPIIAAGGIFYGGDIKKFQDLGAAGVQMATRFVTTDECDADIRFKEAYLKARKEDIVIIDSPVGMPGRAIDNEFLASVRRGETKPISCGYHCIKSCKPKESPYCIADVLINAQKGNLDRGFAFCGSNAWRNKEDGIISVKKLFEKLDSEYASGKVSN